MKLSDYNIFIPYREGKTLLYNTYTNRLAVMENDKVDILQKSEKPIEALGSEIIDKMRESGFLIEDGMNELEILKYRMLETKYSTRTLDLTIAPTYDCNFRCIYCFEKSRYRSCYMDEKTITNIIDFIEKQGSSLDRLSVTWYGGEPLLAMEIIQKLSTKILEICHKFNIQYHAGMVTNGFLLSKEMYQSLDELQIKNIQITIDGIGKDHDEKRYLENGGGTFETIINNLKNAEEYNGRIAVRINCDKKNAKETEKLLQYMKKENLKNRIVVYAARVENDNQTYDDNLCLSVEEFCDLKKQFNLMLEKYGFSHDIDYPLSRCSYCGCDKMNSMVIGADGLLYKCWDDIGEKELSIGDIDPKKGKALTSLYFKYMLFDPTEEEKCKKCTYLPICLSGCPHKRWNRKQEICRETKYRFNDKIIAVADKVRQVTHAER